MNCSISETGVARKKFVHALRDNRFASARKESEELESLMLDRDDKNEWATSLQPARASTE